MPWAEKLPSGRYRALYRDALGKKRSAGTFRHKAEAVRKAGAAEEKARRQIWRDPDAHKRTWGEWCTEWWPTRSVSASTLKSEESRRGHLEAHWSGVPLGAIGRHAVKAWRTSLGKGGMSHSTANRCVALLSASLSAAVDAEILDHNPILRLGKLDEPPQRKRFLSVEDYQRLLDQMPSQRDQLIVTMLASTGLRWGELAGLHWKYVDLANERLTVSTTWSEREGQMIPYPKGKREREVPVPDWLAAILADLPREGQTCGQPHKVGECPGPLVMTTAGGSVLRNPKWSATFRQALKDAEIEPIKIHDLRAAAASWWLADGRDLSEVRVLLGHIDPTTTDRYAQIDEVNAKRAAKAIPRPKLSDLGTLSHESPTKAG